MTVIIFISILILLYVLSTMCRKGHPGLQMLRGWAYAHRGLHGDGVPENSLEAFRRARDAGYGAELDIHLLADGNLAVIHDSLLKRTTGSKGYIEDLTTDQLKDHKLEGTDHTIPTFQEVLDLFGGKAPLIIELKAERNNAPALCHKACQMLDGYKGVYCLESFDPRCIRWMRKNRPDLIRGQLTDNYLRLPKSGLPWVLKFILTNQMMNFLLLPDFVAYRFNHRKCVSNFLVEKLWGVQSVTWTLQSREQYDTAVKEGRIQIFENFKP